MLKLLKLLFLLLMMIPFVGSSQCNVSWTTTSSSITINGLDTPHSIFKLFDPNWNIISDCFDDCQDPVFISGLTNGATYHVSYNLYDANWQAICEDVADVIISGSTGGNSNKPDLTLSNLIIQSSGKAGEVLGYQFNLNNIGNATAQGDYKIKAYLSTDNVLSANDAFAGDVFTGNTPIGTIANVGAAITVPDVSAGNYFLILKADFNDVISENNETNNEISSSFTVIETTSGGDACGFRNENITEIGRMNGPWSAVENATGFQINVNTRETFGVPDNLYTLNIDDKGNFVNESIVAKVVPIKKEVRFNRDNSTGTLTIKYEIDGIEQWATSTVLNPGAGLTYADIPNVSGVKVYDGFLVAGTVVGLDAANAVKLIQFTIKLDNNGAITHVNMLGEQAITSDYFFHIYPIDDDVRTTLDYFVIVQYASNLAIAKFSESGSLLWFTGYTGDLPSNSSIQVFFDPQESNIFTVDVNNEAIQISKINTSNGSKVFEINLGAVLDEGEPYASSIRRVLLTQDGGLVSFFKSAAYSAGGEISVYGKIDAQGKLVWQQKIDTESFYFPILETTDGSILFAGLDILSTTPFSQSVSVMKVTANGALTPNCDGGSGTGEGQDLACDLQYSTTNGSLSIFGNGMNADHVIIQIFDQNWQTVSYCLDDCGGSVDLTGLDNGKVHHVKVTLYAGANGAWNKTCEALVDVMIGQNGNRPGVEVLGFQVTQNGKNVDMSWAVDDFKESAYFILEKSNNGVDFEKVLKVRPTANSMNFTDSMDDDMNFYRVIQVLKNGEARVSSIRPVVFKSIKIENGILYPNPAQNEVNIELASFVGHSAQINIVNTMGQTVLKKSISEISETPIDLDVSQLQSGFYQVTIEVNNDVLVKKMMIVK